MKLVKIWTEDKVLYFDKMSLPAVAKVLEFKRDNPKAHAEPELWDMMRYTVLAAANMVKQIGECVDTINTPIVAADEDAEGDNPSVTAER